MFSNFLLGTILFHRLKSILLLDYEILVLVDNFVLYLYRD